MKQLPIVVLKGCPYVGVPLCKVCVPSAFGGRAGFDMDASHLFPQGVLAAITLLGGGAGDEGVRGGAWCEAGLSLCSVAITTLSGVGSGPKMLKRKPLGSSRVGSVPFKYVLSPLPALGPLPQRGLVLKQGGPVWALGSCQL